MHGATYLLQIIQSNIGSMAGRSKAPAAVVNELPFVSRRSAVLGVRGMVACSQPLASEVRHIFRSLPPPAISHRAPAGMYHLGSAMHVIFASSNLGDRSSDTALSHRAAEHIAPTAINQQVAVIHRTFTRHGSDWGSGSHHGMQSLNCNADACYVL